MKTEKLEPTINPDNYLGKEVQIVMAEYIMSKFGEGVKLTGESLELVGQDTLPEGKTLNPSRIFGLSKNKNGEIIVAEGGHLDKFLQNKNIKTESLPEFKEGEEISVLLGVHCKVQKNVKNNFLDLV